MRLCSQEITAPAALLLVLALAFVAGAAPAMAQAGTKIEDGVLDFIHLHDAAPTAEATVVVRLFDAEGADLGTGAEGGKPARVEAVKAIQSEGPELLADGMIAELKKLGTFADAVKDPGGEEQASGIIVEGRFTVIDPGSRAKRYWAGFGAGKGRTEIEGTIKDASGKVLAKFRQKRLIVMGVGGGDYIPKMRADCRRLGEDIAQFLDAWVKGKNLRKG